MKGKFYFTLAMGTILLAACQKDDLGIREQEVFTSAYNREFTNTFGDVDPNQNWDATTRAMTSYESVASDDGWYYVESQTLNWLKTNLPEDTNNKKKGTRFSMVATENSVFEIIPIYHGQASYDWSVDIIIKDASGKTTTKRLWEKGQAGLQEYGKDRYKNKSKWYERNPEGWYEIGNDGDRYDYATSEHATQLRAQSQQIEVPANSTIYFQINSDGGKMSKGTSIANDPAILCLEGCPAPQLKQNFPDYDVKILACEGYSPKSSDHSYSRPGPDFNEIVFLVTGYVPQAIVEDTEVTTTSTKRYMMEDFGSIDWDFNDVVVDVTTTTVARYKINTETGATSPVGSPRVSHTAKIAHLGGTYPVQVKVGNTLLPKISDPLNQQQTEAQLAGTFSGTPTYGHNGTSNIGWQPTAAAVTVEGFNPATNNVSIKVWKDYNPGTEANSEKVWTTEFPEAGAKPFIIAVRSYDRWTEEGVSVKTASWWGDLWGTTTEP